jgi:predicted metal-dependent phosphoesterase TrpH
MKVRTTQPGLRCDLHVHSRHSGTVSLPGLGPVGRECYSEPREVYERAKRRGMDLVTLTDHDSIEGALELLSLPGTFVSEEVTSALGDGRQLHLGVYDISAAQHEQIVRRRSDPDSLFAYLGEQRIPTAVNHLFSALTGGRAADDFERALANATHLETLNGMMPALLNRCAARAARSAGLPGVGGSDAHTLASVARAWTRVPGSRSPEQFLQGLRRGLCLPGGDSGGYLRQTLDVARVFTGAYAWSAQRAFDGPRQASSAALLLALAPALPLLPLVTALLRQREQAFARRWFARFRPAEPRVRRPRPGPLGSPFALGGGR